MLMDMLLLVWDKLGQLVSRVGVVSGSEAKLFSIMIIIDTYGSLPINDIRGVNHCIVPFCICDLLTSYHPLELSLGGRSCTFFGRFLGLFQKLGKKQLQDRII